MARKADRWAVVAALTLSMALAWDAKPTWGSEARGEPVSERQGLADRGYWSSSGDWRSPSGRGPDSSWRRDWRHDDRGGPRDRSWQRHHYHPHAGWWGAPWPPAPPVWVPGRWVWNGWGWVWAPGYWAY